MNVVLLYGGRSGEHEISLMSCAAVLRNLGTEHVAGLIFISRRGEWFLQDASVREALLSDPQAALGAELGTRCDSARRVSVVPGGGPAGALRAGETVIPADVVFPVLHGTYGEDGTVQGLLEMAALPYVGCGVFASAATMDKSQTKILWQHAGLPVVPYRCLTRADAGDSRRYDELVQEAVDSLGFPLFVKPCSAGSSDGAARAEDARRLSSALMEAFQWDNKVLIEQAVDAREVECSVTGNSVTADASVPVTVPAAYGPGEVVPRHAFYDYDAKYTDPDGADLVVPAALPADVLAQIRTMAVQAYRAVDASGLARVDFFIDRGTGALYLNEINTIPGFTSISMYPKMCEADGLGCTALLDVLFTEARARFDARAALCTSRSGTAGLDTNG